MQQPKKSKGGAPAPMSIAEHAARGAVKDPQSARMLTMGKALGNDEVQRRLDKGNATRDELLLYMSSRLSAMREAQVREEHSGTDEMRKSSRKIADIHKPEYTLPEPTRWHEAARIYEQAAYQLCRGDLSRGSELIRRAMDAERKAFERVGKQVGAKDLEPDEQEPAALEQVVPEQGCAPCDVPESIERLADEIQRNTTTFKDQPVKRRVADPWWTEEEEEEEEGKPADAGT